MKKKIMIDQLKFMLQKMKRLLEKYLYQIHYAVMPKKQLKS